MAEGLLPYPRWSGDLSPRTRLLTVAANELRATLRSSWGFVAVLFGLGWGLVSIIELYNLREAGAGSHSIEGYLAMLRQLLWFSLGVGAAVGGPSLLEDARSGALELYLSRAVTRTEYLAGKVLALLGLTTLTLLLPALLYWGASYVFYSEHPPGWETAILSALLFSLMWGLLVSGLALGLSSVSRSSGAGALLLFGSFATLGYLVDPPGLIARLAPVTSLTEDARWAILSPFAALEAQFGWLFATDPPHEFPAAWGLGVWAALTALGWGLLAWRHPRPRGVERGA